MADITTRQTTATGVVNNNGPLSNAQLDTNFIELVDRVTARLPLTGGTITGNLDITDTVSTKIIKQTQGQISANTNTTTLDFSSFGNFYVTLSSNTTFTFNNLANEIGSTGYIFLKQDATGGRTITLPSVVKTPGGRAINQITAANSLSVITYYVIDASTVIINYIADFK